MDYITRAAEQILLDTAQTFKALLLTGARQVGKSTLLGRMFPEYPQASCDDPLLRAQAAGDPALFLLNHPPPVLLDEIQHAPELFPHIKMACDRGQEKGRFLLTGSQPLRLMERVAESLAGRVGIVELCGLSLREMQGCAFTGRFLPTPEYLAARRPTVRPEADIWRRIHRGGYPEMQDEALSWNTFYSSYVQTYLERDVSQIVKVRDKLLFTAFLQAAAARTGGLLNFDNLADELGMSAATARAWLSVLEASGIALLLQPFSNSALNRAVKTPKLYFRDTGLACFLTRWDSPETARAGAMAGALFETFVVNEIVKSYAAAGIDHRFHLRYYRGKDRLRRNGRSLESEIDLVLCENGVNYPIEIKMTANPRPEMAAAFELLDRPADARRGPGVIVCLYPEALYLERDLLVCPPWWL